MTFLRARAAASLAVAACVLFAASAAAQTLASAEAGSGGPRFMSLRHDKANGRRGPAAAQPVLWEYRVRGLPVEILGKSGSFYWVRDPVGDRSWMHKSQLSTKKFVYALGPEQVAVLERPRAVLKPNAVLAPGAVVELLACEGSWRKVKVKNREGWARADHLFAADQCDQ